MSCTQWVGMPLGYLPKMMQLRRVFIPQSAHAANIAHFKKQLEEIGAIYDWSKESNTTDPNYYKWTQWIFLKMYQSWSCI